MFQLQKETKLERTKFFWKGSKQFFFLEHAGTKTWNMPGPKLGTRRDDPVRSWPVPSLERFVLIGHFTN